MYWKTHQSSNRQRQRTGCALIAVLLGCRVVAALFGRVGFAIGALTLFVLRRAVWPRVAVAAALLHFARVGEDLFLALTCLLPALLLLRARRELCLQRVLSRLYAL